MKKSFALTGRRHLDCLTQGVALGYRDIGLSARSFAMTPIYRQFHNATEAIFEQYAVSKMG